MATNWIVVGDTTTSGGAVVSGSPFTDIDGKSVARVNDRVVCGRHGATTITSGDATTIIDGQAVARQGDKCACGCALISVGQRSVFIDTGAAVSMPVSGMSRAQQPTAAFDDASAHDRSIKQTPADPARARDVIIDSHDALMQAGAYREYDTEVEAAREWRKYVLPVADEYGVEVGALITRTSAGKYRLSAPFSSGESWRVKDLLDEAPSSDGQMTAAIHTHPKPHGWIGGDRAFAYHDAVDSSGIGGYGGTGDVQTGDLTVGYARGVNVYVADSARLHGWNFEEYRALQRQDQMRPVRLNEVFRTL